MKKFCREIGIDKRTLISMINGGSNNGGDTGNRNDFSSSRGRDMFSSSKENMITKDSNGGGQQVNTGAAA